MGKIAGLELSARPSAIVSALILWLVLAVLGFALLRLAPFAAFLGGLVATVLYWLSDLAHQLGHAWAARRVGYPMRGVLFWAFLSASLYPVDEPSLPARVHIRRALGGPVASFFMSLVALLVFLVTRQSGILVTGLALFFFLVNFLVFTIGALLPLGFTDGSTLLKWWGSMKNSA